MFIHPYGNHSNPDEDDDIEELLNLKVKQFNSNNHHQYSGRHPGHLRFSSLFWRGGGGGGFFFMVLK